MLLQYRWLYSLCCAYYSGDLFIPYLEAYISHSLSSILPTHPDNHQFVLCIYRSDSVLCLLVYSIVFFYIPHMSEYGICLLRPVLLRVLWQMLLCVFILFGCTINYQKLVWINEVICKSESLEDKHEVS